MALDDRIRTSVDQAVGALVAEVRLACDEDAARRLAEAEARLTAEFSQKLTDAQAEWRALADTERQDAVNAESTRVRDEAQAAFDGQLAAAVAAATAARVSEADARVASVQSDYDARLQTQHDTLTAQLDALRQDADTRLQTQHSTLTAQLDALRQEADTRLQAAMGEAETRLQSAVGDAETRAITATQASAAAARAREREQETAGMPRLVESIRGLDGASSLSEVLDALALAAARETARAAVFVVKTDRAVGWRLAGFGSRDALPKSVDMDLKDASLIGLAATSSRAAISRDGDTTGPGFEPLPADRKGVAMPVLVGGRAVAVLYADGVTAADGACTWPEVIEVLARHAGRCLEALTAQKAASPPKRAASGAAPSANAGAAG
ncbi:MAG: hypothetical protein IT178_02120 [Acidobacteria bacterium]|nr:hypothetical protein [Acidobacteriota bacterium]